MKYIVPILMVLLVFSSNGLSQPELKSEMGAVNLQESNLPIVVVSTDSDIREDRRVDGHMGIIWNKGYEKNAVSEAYNDYDGHIAIEYRGHSSLEFPKKSYRLETQYQNGMNLNARILDMPADDDWILYAPYSDKTLMRNFLVYTLAAEINDYAPRVRFCELIVNDEYKGVYVMTEKIKENNDRVDIAELTAQHTAEPEITGGYIFRKDWTESSDNLLYLNYSQSDLIINEPRQEEITARQQSWLTGHLNAFDEQLHTTGEYANYVDVTSFAENFILVELAKNIDGYRLSTYFHKDRGEKIKAGPVWDYNLSLGNADYNDGWDPTGWYYPLITDHQLFWFKEMIADTSFMDSTITRWKQLRKGPLSLDHIYSLVDHWSGQLEEAQTRNFSKYDILGRYVWPNPGYPESGSYGYSSPTSGAPKTWEGEVAVMKDFIRKRLEWMDEQFGSTRLRAQVKVDNPPYGKILHHQGMVEDSNSVELSSGDSLLRLTAVPAQGYRLDRWELRKRGHQTTTLIEKGSSWKYLDKGAEPAGNWVGAGFDDSAWEEGPAQLGYGDGDEQTVVDYGPDPDNKYITTYFRHTFQVEDTSRYKEISLELLRDDGAVVYLNGEEVIRSNMPEGEISYSTYASQYIAGAGESSFHHFTLDAEHLMPGKNILAMEIHQSYFTSSDISFDLSLTGILKRENNGPVNLGEKTQLTYKLQDNRSLIMAFFEQHEPDSVAPVINEFMAFNRTGIKDDFFENDDWIELYNPLDQPVDIEGLFLSDDPARPKMHRIPPGASDQTTLAPKDYMVLWADGDTLQGPLHLNFRLDKESEIITLAREENGALTFLDVVSFHRQTSDVSRGRYPDGTMTWRNFHVPTPGESNVLDSTKPTGTDPMGSDGYSLEAGYPNPFQHTTTIRYRIPVRKQVKIAVYNSMGELMEVLVNQQQSAGDHTIRWHAEGLAPGVYFYRMTSGNFSRVRKALIVR